MPSSSGSVDRSDPPNVVLITSHDLGRYLGCYGAPIETPAVDRLAQTGACCNQFFATAPQCSPSRASLLTGQYPHNHGIMGLASRGDWQLDEAATPLPAHLAEAGYRTALIGVQHVAADAGPWVGVTGRPEQLGYQQITSYEEDCSRAADVAERFTTQLEGLADEAPFFATLGFSEPHRPFRRDYVSDEAYDARPPDTVEPLPYLPDRAGVRTDLAELGTLIAETLDPAVGRIMDAIESAGLSEDTIIVLTTDHGIAMPRAKGTCYDPGLEAAFLIRYPEVIPAGRTHDALLSNVDFLPTLCELIGIDSPSPIDGRSFASLLRDDHYDRREHIFAEMTWHGFYDPMRAVRTERYKYIRSFWDVPEVSIPPMGSEAAKAVSGELCADSRPMELLYDLEADPYEQDNLASDRLLYEPAEFGSDPDPNYRDVLVDLRSLVRNWMIETDDPLCDGVVEPPYPGLPSWNDGTE